MDERRRIASDLHDGVVQDLAGISYALSAAAGRASADSAGTLEDAARGTRETMRRLRSVIVDIHPPNLRTAGLEAALRDLLAPLAAEGIDTVLEVADVILREDVELLLYRAAGEALRNIRRHAAASRVVVRVSPSPRECDSRSRTTGLASRPLNAKADARPDMSAFRCSRRSRRVLKDDSRSPRRPVAARRSCWRCPR